MPNLFRFAAIAAAVTVLSGPAIQAQQVTLAGLRAQNGQGAFHGLRHDSAGNLYTLFDARDGVRLLKFNASGTQLLGQAQIGSAGDTGIALDLDTAGNIYIAGTSTSLGTLTGTAGTAFPTRTGSSTNSFVAKFTSTLTQQWLSFCGSGATAATGVAATSTSVLVTGSIFTATLPVTSGGIQQTPAPGSVGNGFVESFSASTGTLQYATYLTGANGDTSPAAIDTDTAGNAYIAGTTTATGFPTTAALVPTFRSTGNTSGFVTKLNPAGDGFVFSTFVPGSGLTSVAIDTAGSGSVLLSGNISSGHFPLSVAQAPIASKLSYQSAVRMALDGSSATSTLLAPAAESVIAPGPAGTAWVFADASLTSFAPLLPVTPIETLGNAFAIRIAADNTIDRTARFGGLPTANTAFASLPVTADGITVQSDGTPALAGAAAPTLSSSLLSTQRYDLPLAFAPTTALPSTVRDALPPATCNGSACSGSAGLLALLAPDASAPTLALSTDALPNLILRNLGTTAANSVSISATGYTSSTTCGGTLAPGAECPIALTGSGPGSITVQASNAPAFTTQLPASTATLNPISALPHELDFGIQTSTSTPSTRTITVINLGTTTQTFASRSLISTTTPYTIAESASTCTPSGDAINKVLAGGGSCTITLQFTASSDAANDVPINARWQIGSTDILVTGYSQAAASSLSATTVDFGRQFVNGLRTPRYVFLSNASSNPVSHNTVTSAGSAFTVVDECPATLQPRSVCRIALAYNAATAPSSDAVTLGIDGTSITLLGETLPQPSIGGASANPNLTLSTTSVSFTSAVTVTTASSETQTVSVGNSGAAPFALTIATTGDFAQTSNCPDTLAGGATCNVILRFTPSDGGQRTGLLAVAGGTSSPAYVQLSGTATAILPLTNGLVSFGDIPLNTPAVQWLKVAQPFRTFAATSNDPSFSVVLVEDSGSGPGQPIPSAYTQTATGTCLNCFLGIRFLPTTTGTKTGTVTLSSPGNGKPQALNLRGNATPVTGPILTPVALDFGSATLGSSTGTTVFQLANASATPLGITSVTIAGDFALSSTTTGGTPCTATSLPAGASCVVAITFLPTATGARTGTLTIATSAGDVTSALAGTGAESTGIGIRPTSLTFNNVPGDTATTQTVTITNTGTQPAAVGTPTISDSHFTASGTCGTLTPAASCTLTITFNPGSATATGALTIPVTKSPTAAPTTANYTVALSGQYTVDTSGLQVVPGQNSTINFGAAPTGSPAATRVLHVTNTAGTPLSITASTPRQFALTASTCATLATGASCDITLAHTPLTAGDTTGTVFLQGLPTDGSTVRKGLGYLQGYGTGSGTLAVSGEIQSNGNVTFGQAASGQTVTRVLILTNPIAATAPVNVRRIRTQFPFASTTTCAAPLAPGQSCTVTLTYTPLFQTTTAVTNPQIDNGVLTVESDAANAPLAISLIGQASAAVVATPSNTAPIGSFTTSQGSLTFSLTAVGSASASQPITITNNGTQTLHILGIVTQPSFAATSDCTTLIPNATCTLQVQFRPQTAGTTLGTLEIQTDSSVSLDFVSLLGTASAASVQLTPQTLDFGRVLVGRSGTALATLSNTGTVPVTLNSISVTGATFSLATASTAAPCPSTGGTLAAGASCTIAAVFSPASAGTFLGSLSVSTSATALPLTVALSGVGTQPQLTVTPAALDFGNVLSGTSKTLSLTLSNVSTTPVDGLSFAVSPGYTVSSTCGITTVNAASSCSISVTYTASTPGASTGTLTISSADPASPILVPLTATTVQGGSFILTVNGGATSGITVQTGAPANYSLAITPTNGYTGTVALTCAADKPAPNIFCSITPPTVTLLGATQSATATITTISAVQSASAQPRTLRRTATGVALAILPAAILLAGARRRRITALVSLVLMMGFINGCGSGGDNRLRYADTGTYTFRVTASSTNTVPVTQTVTLTLVVTPR